MPPPSVLQAFLVRHHRLLFLGAIGLAYLGVLFGVVGIRDTGDEARSLARVATAAIELGFAGLLCAGCLRMALRGWRVPWVVASVAIAAAVAVAYLAQVFSLYVSRNFITLLAMQNADSVGFVESTLLQVGAGLLVFGLLVFGGSAWMASHAPRDAQGAAVRWSGRRYAIALVACGLPFAYLFFIQGGNLRLEAGFRQSPVANLAVTGWRFLRPPPSAAPVAAGAPGLACYRGGYDADAEYPFLQARAYETTLPFPPTDAGTQRPNIIIVFAEGVSARLLGAYGGTVPGLMPHLDRFASQAMRVDNYFNHTAATFRGLQGQLTSGYPLAGGGGATGWVETGNQAALLRIERQSLADVLNDAGYDTHMFVPHRRARPLIRMLERLGFSRVHHYESIRASLPDGEARGRPGTTALDDQTLFRALRRFLERREASGDARPFLAATYNIGTHAFLERSNHDTHYRDTDNPVLDKMHNFDAVLGAFLDDFLAGPYADDTLLVVTSDHATYPEPAYRDVAGEGLKPYFVDRIPLLVRDPHHALPATFDAQGRTSLALAPTVLHLAGLQTRSNAFLGRSLFEPRVLPVGIAALGEKHFMTSPEGVFAANEVPAAHAEAFGCAAALVDRFQAAEAANRIFPAEAPSPPTSRRGPTGPPG